MSNASPPERKFLPWWPHCLGPLRPTLKDKSHLWPTTLNALQKIKDIRDPSPLYKLPTDDLNRFQVFQGCPPEAALLFHILERLAKTLETDLETDINPFLEPFTTECMPYTVQKENHPLHRNAAFSNMMRERVPAKEGGSIKGKYLRLNLGKDEGGHSCIEGAHRLVLLATLGPPPAPASAEEGDVPPKPWLAAHLCDNQACLNPLHLAWATYNENNVREFAWNPSKEAKERVKKAKERIKQRLEDSLQDRGLNMGVYDNASEWVKEARRLRGGLSVDGAGLSAAASPTPAQ